MEPTESPLSASPTPPATSDRIEGHAPGHCPSRSGSSCSLWNSDGGSEGAFRDYGLGVPYFTPWHTFSNEENDSGCTDSNGHHYPFKVKFDDRYPMKDPAKYTEFERRYPPDRFGEEASDNARVWKLYRDRVTGRDEDQIEGWNKTIDILLIFAGLFSAVATAFIIESYKQLQPDYTEYLARTFAASLNRTDSGAFVNPIPDLANFRRPVLARGVNTLWFLSLALALIAALLAILAKQWLNEYTSRMRRHISSHRRWAWRHFVYYGGLERWGVEGFISFLPVMLHAALLLFLAGLVGFLADIDWAIGGLILVVTVMAAIFYVSSMLVPLWFGDCPTTTPLLRQGRRAAYALRNAWYPTFQTAFRLLSSYFGTVDGDQATANPMTESPPAFNEDVLLNGNGPSLDAKILQWMIISLPAAEETDAALDTVGSLDLLEHLHQFHEDCPGVYGKPLPDDPLCNVAVRSAAFSRFWQLVETWHVVEPVDVAGALRAMLFLGHSPFIDSTKPVALRGVDPGLRMDLFLHRCQSHTTHDLRLLSMAVSEFRPGFFVNVADNIAAWANGPGGDRGDTTERLPYLASSLALSFLRPLVGLEAEEQAGLIRVLCALMPPGYSLTFSVAQHRSVFCTVQSNVHRILPALPAPPNLSDYFSLVHTSEQIQIRTLATLATIMSDVGQLPSELLDVVAQTFSRGCLMNASGLAPADLEDLLNVTKYVILRSQPNDISRVAHLFSIFIGNVSCWSAEVGAVSRLLLFNIENLSLSMSDVQFYLFLLFQPDNCAEAARHLAANHSSAADAERHSRVNILTADADRDRCWDFLWAFDMFDPESILCRPTHVLVSHLCALKRSGLVLPHNHIQQLLGHNRGYRVLNRFLYPHNVVTFARHGRELSSEWWETTKIQLLATHEAPWGDPDKVFLDSDAIRFTTTAEFVAHVDALGPCTLCPSRLEFTGRSADSEEVEVSSPSSNLPARVLRAIRATSASLGHALTARRTDRSNVGLATSGLSDLDEQV